MLANARMQLCNRQPSYGSPSSKVDKHHHRCMLLFCLQSLFLVDDIAQMVLKLLVDGIACDTSSTMLCCLAAPCALLRKIVVKWGCEKFGRRSHEQQSRQVATHCSRHKLDGQVDLKNRRYLCRHPAGCQRLASFGHVLHGRPLFCARHKSLQVIKSTRAKTSNATT